MPFFAKQFGVRALFGDFAVVDDDDFIGIVDGRQPMCDDYRSTIAPPAALLSGRLASVFASVSSAEVASSRIRCRISQYAARSREALPLAPESFPSRDLRCLLP